MAAISHELCLLTDISEGTARGFEVPGADGPVELIVLRWGAEVSAFVNACPHQGTPLNTTEDRFFTRDGRFLLCRTHGARFRPEDGVCVSGPCVGDRLAPHAVRVKEGRVLATFSNATNGASG